MNLLLVPTSDWIHHPTKSRLHHIFERLARRHTVNVLWFRQARWGAPPRKTHAKLFEATSIPARDLSAYYLLNTSAHLNKIESIIRNEHIDVIVFANILAGSTAVISGAKHHIPVVCDYLDHYAESAGSYYSNKAIAALVTFAVSSITRWNVENSSFVVTISESFKDILVNEYHVAPERITMIPNGVDPRRFTSMGRDIAQRTLGLERFKNSLCVCYAGAVESWSNLEAVSRVIQRLNEEGKEVALFVVGGSLGTSYYHQLRTKFERRECFLFTGFVNETLVPIYISAADICILPSHVSRISAGLPLKLLEYLACKRPVVCTPIPEVEKALKGIVTLYANDLELESLLREICEGKRSLQKSVDRGYMFAQSRSWEHLSELYENVLLKLVSSAVSV